MCLVIGYLCCALPLSNTLLLCGVCKCVCVSYIMSIYLNLYMTFCRILKVDSFSLSVFAYRFKHHVRLRQKVTSPDRRQGNATTLCVAVHMRPCLWHYYYYFFNPPRSGMVEHRKLMGLCLTIVSPCGRQSQWFSFKDSKRVVKEKTEEELCYCGITLIVTNVKHLSDSTFH